MGGTGLLNPVFSLQHLLASSLKNNPSIRSQFGDEHFLQRCSPSTHPLPGASRGEAGNEVPKAETLSPARHRPTAETSEKPPTP